MNIVRLGGIAVVALSLSTLTPPVGAERPRDASSVAESTTGAEHREARFSEREYRHRVAKLRRLREIAVPCRQGIVGGDRSWCGGLAIEKDRLRELELEPRRRRLVQPQVGVARAERDQDRAVFPRGLGRLEGGQHVEVPVWSRGQDGWNHEQREDETPHPLIIAETAAPPPEAVADREKERG